MLISRRFWTATALVALACGGGGSSTGPGGPGSGDGGGNEGPGEVSVGDNFFRPSTVTVARENGEATVTWRWIGRNQHNVTFDAGGSNSATQRTGSFSRTFTEVGDLTYICTIHGRAVMSGTVTVQ